MVQFILEYIWLDGTNTLRSKTKVLEVATNDIYIPNSPPVELSLSKVPMWSFDGSSTGQAPGTDSDVFIRPVRLYNNPFYKTDVVPKSVVEGAYLVLCECLNRDGTAHASNTRAPCSTSDQLFAHMVPWFGIEQEYILFEYDGSQPHGWVTPTDPGMGHSAAYYCGVGGDRAIGRGLMDTHMMHCLRAGISICGTNLEVTASQLEYQVGPRAPTQLADDLVMSRYILLRLSEDFECAVSFEPKPLGAATAEGAEWNGSGAHCNFSDKDTRTRDGGLCAIRAHTQRMESHYPALLAACGANNHLRLTGTNEAPDPTQFTVGEGNRGASVRVPHLVLAEGKGYLEFRAPGANVDPYLLINTMMRVVYDPPSG
jgi:glutamine synthetase